MQLSPVETRVDVKERECAPLAAILKIDTHDSHLTRPGLRYTAMLLS